MNKKFCWLEQPQFESWDLEKDHYCEKPVEKMKILIR